MYKDDAGPLLDWALPLLQADHEVTLQIATSLAGSCCIVDCEWQSPTEAWDDCLEDSLLAYTERGNWVYCHPSLQVKSNR